MSGRTPGPWTWINSNRAEGRLGRLFGESDLVLDADPGIFGSPEDGRLLAAAPELLAALENIKELWQLECDKPSGRFEDKTFFYDVFGPSGCVAKANGDDS